MNRPPEISRRELEESGEILREKENIQGQSDQNQRQTTDWDSLKDVPLRGDQEEEASSKEYADEEEMCM